jgi:hypothetical protein
VSRKKWNDLSTGARRLIVAGGVIEGVLKAAALFDLVRRPASEVRGSKPKWALAGGDSPWSLSSSYRLNTP